MKNLLIGAHMVGANAAEVVERIVLADQSGVQCAWLTSGGVQADPFVIFGAAAAKTRKIGFGTSIVPTFPKHPLTLVQGAVGLDSLAPGRFRLGVGPSHKPFIEAMFGIPFERPLEHLREYLTILRGALYEGKVDFEGKRLKAHAQLAAPLRVKVLASALRENGFRLCGELADGAISWMCPLSYLRDVAVPALKHGAQTADRAPPPLIAHAPVMVSEDVAAVREAAREQVGIYPKIPYYSQMFQDAGFPEVKDGILSDRLIDEIVIHGSAETVKQRLRSFPSFGASELLATPILPKSDPQAFERTMRILGELAAE